MSVLSVLGAIWMFATSDAGKTLLTPIFGWVAVKLWKNNARAKFVAEHAILWFDAIKSKGDQEGWTNPVRSENWQKEIDATLVANGMKPLSPDELGYWGQFMRAKYWVSKVAPLVMHGTPRL